MDAISVGNYFLSKNKELTDIQIQKLTYYAYAWYMIKHEGQKLFNERPQAWVHGPVFRTLYDAMKDRDWHDRADIITEDNITAFLNIINDVYAKYSGNQLEDMTHSEIPWKNARKRVGLEKFPSIRSQELITDEDIMAWGKA